MNSVQVFEGTGVEPSWLDDLVWEDNPSASYLPWSGRYRGIRVSLVFIEVNRDGSDKKMEGKWQWVFGEAERNITLVHGEHQDTREEAYQELIGHLKDECE